jgi:NADH:ubiquinone oxidoreductase subunit C
MLVDLTAVDWPGRAKRFDVVYTCCRCTRTAASA